MYIKRLFLSVLIMLCLFSSSAFALDENTLVRVEKAGGVTFGYETSSLDPVIVYSDVIHMIANRDEQALMTIYGDGTVLVHHPVYMKKAGDYEMKLSQPELTALLETLADDGLLEFDAAKTERDKKLYDSTNNPSGNLTHISDNVTTQIAVSLKEYKPATSNTKQLNYKKNINLKNIEHDLKRYAAVGQIQKLGNSINNLKALLVRDELIRK